MKRLYDTGDSLTDVITYVIILSGGDSMEYINITNARNNLYKLVDTVGETHEPIVITGKVNNAVLLSEEDWSAIQETIYLNSIPQMAESIKNAANEPISQMTPLEEIDW